MGYIVYHKDTTRYLRNHPKVRTDLTSYETEAAAKAALTREVNRGAVKREDFLIATIQQFIELEKTETKVNMMSGKQFQQKVNTPIGCDPSSETYWSM